jgi:adenosylmethionine-8-amino-7-oxononanoate aminotransferase
MTLYSLKGKTKASDFVGHALAAVAALNSLKKGTAKEVTAYARSNRLLRGSEMDPLKAISWILSDLKKKGRVSATTVATKKTAKKAARKVSKKTPAVAPVPQQ